MDKESDKATILRQWFSNTLVNSCCPIISLKLTTAIVWYQSKYIVKRGIPKSPLFYKNVGVVGRCLHLP